MQKTYDRRNPLLVSYDTLLGSLDAAREIGGDLTPAIQKNGIDARLIERPQGFLPVHKLVGFLDDAAKMLACPNFVLLLAKHQPPLQFGVTGWAIRFAADLREAIRDAVEFGTLNSEIVRWELREDPEYAEVIRHNRVAFPGSLVQLETLSMAVAFKALSLVGGEQWHASQVTFVHSRPLERKRSYEKYFGAPVLFKQNQNSIVFPSSFLDLPNAYGNKEIHDALKAHLRSRLPEVGIKEDLVARLRYYIHQNLGTNRCNLDSIAQQVGLHARTAQRELATKGTSFRQLLNEVRQEVTEHYLRSSSISLIELSDILGYGNASALSRAFKKATGMSPDLWRSNRKPP